MRKLIILALIVIVALIGLSFISSSINDLSRITHIKPIGVVVLLVIGFLVLKEKKIL